MTHLLLEVRELITSEFTVIDEYSEFGIYTFTVEPTRKPLKEAFRQIAPKIKEIGFLPFLRRRRGKLTIRVLRRPRVKPSNRSINLVLFMATCLTVFLSGWIQGFGIDGALLFMATLLSILSLHEFGHKLASHVDKVESSLPYFIPFIPPLGTMGAVITQKDVLTNRDDLFDIGFSGPVLGFFTTIGVALLAIIWSQPIPLSEAQEMGAFPLPLPLLLELMALLRPVPEGYILALELFGSIALFVAWIGAFITLLNVIPVWQLDGGHLVRAVLGPDGYKLASVIGIIIMSIVYWPMALFILFFILMSGGRTPGPLDDVSPASSSRKILAILVLIIGVLCTPLGPIV